MVEHAPVLVREAIELVANGPGWYLDATVGGGGHAAALLRALPAEARLLALDRDPAALTRARVRLEPFGDRVRFVHASFDQLGEVMRAERLGSLAGALFDLGLSSLQLADASRGFSFAPGGVLDLRFDPTVGEPAWKRLERVDEATLTRWLAEYGELPEPRRIARVLIAARARGPLRTTDDLRAALAPVWGRDPHPRRLARLFQALRIAVNDELERVDRGLEQVAHALAPGAVVAAISYHSLEDRRVKRAFQGTPPSKREAQLGLPPARLLEPVTRRALVPAPAEVAANPRAASAKLRAARRTSA